MSAGVVCRPATPERWGDLERLFGPKGACAGCWCMWPRLTAEEFTAGRGKKNRRALRSLVRNGNEPGIIGYRNGKPVGWCAVAPREQFRRLERSRTLRPLDDKPVWAIVCLFVDRAHRNLGVGTSLLKAAARHATANGARIIEGYPIATGGKRQPDVFAWWGTEPAFLAAGFRVVATPSRTRRIVRKSVR